MRVQQHTSVNGPMKFTIFVFHCWISIAQIVFGSSIQETPSCCPIGWTLAQLKVDLYREDNFECLDPTQTTALANEIQIIGKILPLGGLHIQPATNGSNIPNCRHPDMQIIFTANDIDLPSNACLAHFDQRIATISCPTTENDKTHLWSFMHKCCPVDYFYDSTQQKCVQRVYKTSTFAVYSKFFPQANGGVVFLDEPLKCSRDKVLVEYRLNEYKISFEGGQLIVQDTDKQMKHFPIQEYCIEAIMSDGDDDGVGDISDDDFSQSIAVSHNIAHNKILVKQLANVGSVKISNRRRLREYFVRTCRSTEICQHMACIRRCCADGEMYARGNATTYCQKDTSDVAFHNFESLDIQSNFSKPTTFGILRSLDCNKYRLDPVNYPEEAHTINERDGSLYVMSKKNYTNEQYCIEKVRRASTGDRKLYTFLCFDTNVVVNDKIRFKMYPIGLLISCLFYAITLVVYLSISRLRNLPGKILICLVCSLFAAYLSIALGQLMPTSNDDVCFASGFFVYFCLMAAFAWMNVMCFDIWQTFGSAKKKNGFNKKHTKRFIVYSLYGWGLPTIMTVMTVSLTKSNVLNDKIRPHFGHGRCWFSYDTLASANLLFFSGPVGILFLINLFLFSLTLRYCNRVKREIFRMQSSNMEKPMLKRRFFVDKARFAMNTKLFFVMGITWLMELLSILFYDHKKTFFWAISDSFNVLLGVLVFFIFVFKKRVWDSILIKVGLRSQDSTRTLQNTTMATHSTYAQSMTRLNTMDGSVNLLPSGAPRRSPLL